MAHVIQNDLFGNIAQVHTVVTNTRVTQRTPSPPPKKKDETLLDYIITEADNLGEGGQVAKIHANIKAIELVKKLQQEGRKATAEEQKILVQYTGWGHSANVLDERKTDDKWTKHRQKLTALLTQEEYTSAGFSTINAHYTSEEVIRGMWAAVQRLGFKGGRVCEPAAGIGHFFGLMPVELREKSSLTMIELEKVTAAIAGQLYQSAKVYAMGFQDAPIEKESFDLIISNFPFGDISVNDEGVYHNGRGHLAGTGIHNYFFVKALDMVRPGGFVVAITSHFTMDAMSIKVRKYLAEQANLVAAIRLPKDTFKRNAHTYVTTDILVLQKLGYGANNGQSWGQSWLNSVKVDEKIALNEYFIKWPAHMLGTMQVTNRGFRDGVECVPSPGLDVQKSIEKWVEALPQGIFLEEKVKARTKPKEETFSPMPLPHYKVGTIAMDEIGLLYKREREGWSKLPPTANWRQDSPRLRGYTKIRDAFFLVLEANRSYAPDAWLQACQAKLNKAYDDFVRSYGFLHEPTTMRATKPDPDSGSILALEVYDTATHRGEKTPIFYVRVSTRPTTPNKTNDPVEALRISLREFNYVQMDRMSYLTEKSPETLLMELGEKLFEVKEPVKYRDGESVWLTDDEYLSGDVKTKLDEAQRWAAEDKRFQRNVEALERVRPEDKTPGQIFVQLGSFWVPPEVFNDFINKVIFQKTNGWRDYVSVKYLPEIVLWKLEIRGNRIPASPENYQQWGTKRAMALEIIERLMNGQVVTVKDKTLDDKYVVNKKDTLLGRIKAQEIKDAFAAWVWADADRAKMLAWAYNEKLNRVVARKSSGAHLEFPGLNPLFTPREIQRDVVWKGLQQDTIGIFHAVGFGKTASQVMLAMKLKQLGIRNRIVIVVQKSTIGQFANAIRFMYPACKLLIVAGMSKRHRQELLARIATGDYDIILVTHPTFTQIPLRTETEIEYIQEQMHELHIAMQKESKKEPSYKELQKAMNRLEVKLEKRMKDGLAKDPNALYWEDLNVDYALIDEANAWKNLWFPTKLSRLPGVGGTESGRAFDGFVKTRYMRKNGGGLAFATGTPLENTISEVFTMLKFLHEPRLRRYGISNFDAWAGTYGQTVTTIEMKPDGSGFGDKERFASFKNIQSLLQLWLEVADVKQDADEAGIELPKMIGGRAKGVQLPGHPLMKRIIRTLAARVDALADVPPEVDNMLKIVHDADLAALDARLLSPFEEILCEEDGTPMKTQSGSLITAPLIISEDFDQSKINAGVAHVAEIYHSTTGVEVTDEAGRTIKANLTQMIFLDIGAPDGALQHPNPYKDIKQKLVALGVKAEEIAFIQDYDTDAKKVSLFEAMNTGKMRVLIGTTTGMGIGVNAQRLLVGLHHFCCPWKPAWLQQREGRILRQGNLNKEVYIVRYLAEGSFDVYRWQTVERKAKFILQFLVGALTLDAVEDLESVADARAMKALATGDDNIIRREEIKMRLNFIGMSRQDYIDSRYKIQREISHKKKNIEHYEAKIAELQSKIDLIDEDAVRALGAELYDKAMAVTEEAKEKMVTIAELPNYLVRVKGRRQEKIIADNARVQAIMDNPFSSDEEKKAQLAKLNLESAFNLNNDEPQYSWYIYVHDLAGDNESSFELRHAKDEKARNEGNTKELLGRISKNILLESIATRNRWKADDQEHITMNEEELTKPWRYADEYTSLTAELAQVEADIDQKYGKGDKPQQVADEDDAPPPADDPIEEDDDTEEY